MNQIIQPDHNKKRIAEFFAELTKTDRDAKSKRLTYIAVRKGRTWNLLRARLDFNPVRPSVPPPPVISDFVRAGTLELKDCKLTPRTLLTQILSGKVKLPGLTLAYPKGDGSHHTLFYTRDVNLGAINRRIENRLQISGRQPLDLYDHSAVDLDLTGLPPRYGTLDDLIRLYDLKPEFTGGGIWFVASPLVEMVSYERAGSSVKLRVLVRSGYDPKDTSLGIRFGDVNLAAKAIEGPLAIWTSEDGAYMGEFKASLPKQSDPTVIVKYAGKVQHIVRPEAPAPSPFSYSSKTPFADHALTVGAPEIAGSSPDQAKNLEPVSKQPRRLRVLPRVANRLYSVSKNRCAYYGCGHQFFEGEHGLSNICHIRAAKPGGPRHDPSQTEEERRAYENLLLLCPTHHDAIDKDVIVHTVAYLIEMKQAHERKPTEASRENG